MCASVRPGSNYRIRIRGHLAPAWSAWFDSLTVVQADDGTTELVGPLVDQAALFGVLARLRDLGATLLLVEHLTAEPSRDVALDDVTVWSVSVARQPLGSRCGAPRYVADVEQRISLVTLGVADLARARMFYEQLGWRGQEVEQTVFFQAGGSAVVLWGRDKVADDAGVADSGTDGFGGITLAHNVRSPAEVDEVLGRAASAGAAMTQPARVTSYGGYAGFFTDPDGHVWEIAYNPGFPLDRDGAITIPDFGTP